MNILTERLLLRPVEPGDVNDIYEYSKNPNVGPSAGWKPHETKQETRATLRVVFLGYPHVFGIVIKETGKLIGTIGLTDDPKRRVSNARMLGYAIGEPYWGQGYTTEAARALIRHGFMELRLDLISVYCYPENDRSRRVIEKCGFHYEGCMRFVELLFDGTPKDNMCYSITIQEYCGQI